MMDATEPFRGKACCVPSASRSASAATQSQYGSEVLPRNTGNGDFIPIPAGEFLMGSDYTEGFSADGEGPVRRVGLQAFQIDRYPVTNMRFGSFVQATNYRTEAEVFGWSFVFYSHIAPELFRTLVADTVAGAPWWCKVPGASWSSPAGPGSDLGGLGDHPVVHVSWNDAQAFCAWEGSRLPSEAEWECAARGGLEQKLFPWGDQLRPGGEHRCNIWQGEFPAEDTAEDGYRGTCPVGAFPPNGYDLFSMTGNTWEWCQDWFGIPDPTGLRSVNPSGPGSGSVRVMKGGSFLCHRSYCNRYRVAARSSSTPDSSTSNCGFRCAR